MFAIYWYMIQGQNGRCLFVYKVVEFLHTYRANTLRNSRCVIVNVHSKYEEQNQNNGKTILLRSSSSDDQV